MNQIDPTLLTDNELSPEYWHVGDVTMRDYQKNGVVMTRKAFMDGAHAVLYVGPTGCGKTSIFSFIAYQARLLGTRICILVHRAELVDQVSQRLRQFGVPHGIIAAGYQGNPRQTVQVASKDTLIHRLGRHEFDLLIFDECHHILAASYLRIVEHYCTARVLGVTATPVRLDNQGLGNVFDRMILGPTESELTPEYLVPAEVWAPAVALDMKGLRSSGSGDFSKEALAERLNKREITGDVIRHYEKHLNGAPSIAFCCSVQHAKDVAEQFSAVGYRTACLYGAMPLEKRKQVNKDFAAGRLNVMMTCDLVSEGYDVAGCYGGVMLRPTKSLGLWRQQCGRTLRQAPGKTKAIILDHVGNSIRHGLPCTAIEWSLEEGYVKKNEKAAPVRQCPECYFVHPLAPECPNCHYIYPIAEKPVPKQADGELVLVSPEEGQALYREARTLEDFHKWARLTGKKSGAAWYAFKRRQSGNRLERTNITGR